MKTYVEFLPENFEGKGEVKGFVFNLIERGNSALLYSVNDNTSQWFEVFNIRNSAKCIDYSKKLFSETDFKEVYPTAKHFGLWAWTYKSLDDAVNRFKVLEKEAHYE